MNNQSNNHSNQGTENAVWTEFDRQTMALALQLAKKGEFTARPNPMVGCVIVKNGEIIGQGWHQKSGQAHSEVNALDEAGEQAKDATCYVTLEPCAHTGKTAPCAQALIKAGVKQVIAAMEDPFPEVAGKGFEMLRQAGILVKVGLYEEQARALNRGFISRVVNKKPFVTCKLAMSLDGRTALADGSSKWITGPAARSDVQKLRARQDAILTGMGTLLADDPSLTVRPEDCTDESLTQAFDIGLSQPVRILLDKKADASISAKLFNSSGKVIWMMEAENLAKAKEVLNENNGIESGNIEIGEFNPNNLSDLLTSLAEAKVNHLLIEAGHQLAGAFLQQGLIDELIVYVAPKLMGNEGMGLFQLNIASMKDTINLTLKETRHLGDELRLTYHLAKPLEK